MTIRPIAIVLAWLVAAPGDDPAKTDREKHRGTWAVTSMVRDDKAASEEVVASIRRVVEEDYVIWSRDGKRFARTRFEVDATKNPPTIDLIPDGGPARGKRVLGIYRFEKDELTICVADPDEPRPSKFEAKAGTKQTLQTFRKVEP